MAGMRVGVDLGGTKIECLALDRASGDELFRKRIPTPRGTYQPIVAAIDGLVREAFAETGQDGTVGIGIPGVIDPSTGLVRNANSTELNGHPLDRDLAAALGREVRVTNDANCLAVSEASDGAAAGAPVVFGVILGTGVGGGIVVAGKVLDGANAIGGEWGHNPLPWPEDDERPGPSCYCGRSGCIETFLSGPALARDHREHGGDAVDAATIAQRASSDPACEASLQRYERRLARAFASVINLLDPHVIVLGGGLSKLQRLYANVPRLWDAHIFSDRPVTTRLVAPRHGDSSGVRGAAWLWGD